MCGAFRMPPAGSLRLVFASAPCSYPPGRFCRAYGPWERSHGALSRLGSEHPRSRAPERVWIESETQAQHARSAPFARFRTKCHEVV